MLYSNGPANSVACLSLGQTRYMIEPVRAAPPVAGLLVAAVAVRLRDESYSGNSVTAAKHLRQSK